MRARHPLSIFFSLPLVSHVSTYPSEKHFCSTKVRPMFALFVMLITNVHSIRCFTNGPTMVSDGIAVSGLENIGWSLKYYDTFTIQYVISNVRHGSLRGDSMQCTPFAYSIIFKLWGDGWCWCRRRRCCDWTFVLRFSFTVDIQFTLAGPTTFTCMCFFFVACANPSVYLSMFFIFDDGIVRRQFFFAIPICL